MKEECIKEIKLRLKAPVIALEKISKGQYLPKVFVQAALAELRKAQKLTDKMRVQRKES